MLSDLKFVQGAVAKKDFVQALTHFCIKDGYIRGYNGMLALCSPIGLALEATPKAVPFIKAIQSCRETVQITVTATGRLSIKSGKFKAFVECSEEPYPGVDPEGIRFSLSGELLPALKILNPFIAEDDSRRWARGLLFRGSSIYATNNVVLMEYWTGTSFPVEVNIPKPAIQEILRIGVEPVELQAAENSLTFHYPDGRWLKTQTYSTEWPDVSKLLDRASEQHPVPAGLSEAIIDILPFVDDLDRVHLKEGLIYTKEGDEGASFELADIHSAGIFNIHQLKAILPVIHSIDLGSYPAPCLFFGNKLRGALVGMR